MTIGIYALYWAEQDLVYVGQSQNIETRFKEHIRALKNNTHFNYRVQNTYNSYGLPNLIILERCDLPNLDTLEILYIEEFDNTLNIVEGGSNPAGTYARNAKYSRIDILRVFSLLYKGRLTCTEIAGLSKCSFAAVYDIYRRKTHLWLQESYPEYYAQMLYVNRSPCSRIKNSSVTKEELDSLIQKYSWVDLGNMLGYSDNGIKKRAKSLGCIIPTRNKPNNL